MTGTFYRLHKRHQEVWVARTARPPPKPTRPIRRTRRRSVRGPSAPSQTPSQTPSRVASGVGPEKNTDLLSVTTERGWTASEDESLTAAQAGWTPSSGPNSRRGGG